MRRSPKAATIRDVAKRSGFAASTVSIVLNNAALARYVPETTKKKIQDAARTLGYRPNFHARSLRLRKQHTIGLVVFDIADPYCTPILRGIEDTLYQSGYLSIITDVHNDRVRFERSLEMLLARHVEGIIFVANWLFVDIELLADIGRQRIPSIVIGRRLHDESVSSVTVDNQAGAYAALEHLYALGHRRIAFIRGPKNLHDTAERWSGVKAFATKRKLKLDPALVVDLPPALESRSGFENGRRLTEELLEQKAQFTALLAFDDVTALGALRALHAAGACVPEKCAVVGFDDVAHAGLVTPALTTVRQPLERMGATAVTALLNALGRLEQGAPVPVVHEVLSPDLVVRDSSSSAPSVAAG